MRPQTLTTTLTNRLLEKTLIKGYRLKLSHLLIYLYLKLIIIDGCQYWRELLITSLTLTAMYLASSLSPLAYIGLRSR